MIPAFTVLEDDELGEAPGHALLAAYGGPLRIRGGGRRVVANFVATLDGVISFGPRAGAGAGAVSLGSAADRFVMALLRSASDALLIGAATLRRDPHHQWTAATVFPTLADQLADLRREITGEVTPAPLVIVTGRGELPAEHPALSRPQTEVLVVTTSSGRPRLPVLGAGARAVVAGAEPPLDPRRILEAVAGELGAATVLTEAGPSLFSQLLATGAVDELFLTLAPQLAGLGADGRLGLLGDAWFAPDATPRLRLRSLRRADQHLLLRYAVETSDPA
ncbi:MAG: dihydrofolate reductase family protein [Candidatus Dormibacteria bacterium]